MVPDPPEGDNWLHEIKFDGYRSQIIIDGGKAAVYSRSGLDWSDRYPFIAEEAAALKCRSAVIDGEAIVQDELGRPDFSSLRRAITRWPHQVLFYAFDLLHLNGRDLRQELLIERRAGLVKLLKPHITQQSRIQLSDIIEDTGAAAYTACCEHGLEGIVSKRRDSPYLSGSSRSWVKAKCWEESDLVIIGSEPDTRSGAMRLLLADDEDTLIYMGKALFTPEARERQAMRALLKDISAPGPPIAGMRKGKVQWVRPVLRVRVRHLKGKSRLRHASVRGFIKAQ